MKPAKTLQILMLAAALVLLSGACAKERGGRIKAPGIVDGDIITLKAQVAGTVQSAAIAEGQRVEKDTVIAKIDSEKIENQLQELDIAQKEIRINREKLKKKSLLVDENLNYLRKQVQRFRRLKKSQSLPGEQLENMELKLLEAETSAFDLQKGLESLNVQEEKIANKRAYLTLLLNDHTVRSPVKGEVVETFVSVGESVFPGAALVDILDTSSLFVEVFLEEQEIAVLRLNQRVKIVVDGMEDKDLFGTISLFGRKAEFSPRYVISEKERKSLLYRVKVKIAEESGVFKVGMPVTVLFNSETKR